MEEASDYMAIVNSDIDVLSLTPVIGAEVRGVDLGQALPDALVLRLRQALLDHGVIFFRDQELEPEQHLELAQRFGNPAPSIALGYPELALPEVGGATILDQHGRPPSDDDLSDGQRTAGDVWHCDNLFMEEPLMGALLYGVEVPPTGGDTCFASRGALYESFSPTFRMWLDGLTAVNSMAVSGSPLVRKIIEKGGQAPTAVHPVVSIHPETGRKTVNVSPNWTERIVELLPSESDAVLEIIHRRLVSTPDLQCRFRWENGSVAFWDNRAVYHRAVGDYSGRRLMRRVFLAGDRPQGVASNGGQRSASRL